MKNIENDYPACHLVLVAHTRVTGNMIRVNDCMKWYYNSVSKILIISSDTENGRPIPRKYAMICLNAIFTGLHMHLYT